MNNTRALEVIVIIFVLFIALAYRLFDVQIIKSDEFKYYAQRQQMTVEKIKAERGLIFDRNGTLLVYNRNDVSYYLDLRMVSKKGKIKIADKFSKVFGKGKEYYLSLMNKTGRTVCIEEKAPAEKAMLLKDFKVNGLFHKSDPTRVYVYKDLASHILGYVGDDYHGVAGVAKTFDDKLAGDNGSMVILRDAIGDMVTVAQEQTKPAVPGLNLYLTINKTYQSILEDELRSGLEKFGGTSAVGIIMDPNTGEVLSLANIADYNPNEYWLYSNSVRRDRAITDTYEPGSTFKTFSMASLLNNNLCSLNQEVFADNGRYKFKNVYITDDHKNGWLTAGQVVIVSSNIGMSKLIQRINNDTYYKYLRAFGFGNYTFIKLPGEVRGLLRKPNEWNAVTKAFMSFGYGVTVTPIQLITAYCAVINGGFLYQPEIIEKEVEHGGKIVFRNQPKLIRKVISEKTSEKMRKLLVDVVEEGTGVNAKISSVLVGGKTGTSEKLIDGKYSKVDYNSSFVGFFPAYTPKIVCLILVNSPKIGKYGGSVAAPIFKNVAERIINLSPSKFQNENKDKYEEKKEIEGLFAKNTKSPIQVNTVKTAVNNNLTNRIPFNPGVMPDLKNNSLREAISVLSKLKINYKVQGTGFIYAQSIQPGEKIHKGLTCILDCKEPEVTGAVVY